MLKLSSMFLLFVSMIGIAGCGGEPVAQITGTVTVEGKGPLTGGSIKFVSVADSQKSSSGVISPNGTYLVNDAPVGDCKVIIEPYKYATSGGMGMGPPGGMGMKGMPGGGGPKMGSAPPAGKSTDVAPKGVDVSEMPSSGANKPMKIASGEQSAKVNKGNNSIDFTVKPQ